MNWVSPIKDEETLQKFKEALRRVDDKYYILFEIGVGTGMQLLEILKLKNCDVRDQDRIEASIGSKNIKRVFTIPDELKTIIHDYTEGKNPQAFLIQGYAGSETALSREQAYRVFKSCGKEVGMNSIGAQTMRKTFAWRYYKHTGDIYYLQNLLNHASPSITYRYIGEKPSVEVVMKKMTAEENERSRYQLYQNDNGKKRMEELARFFEDLKKEMDNPAHNDAFYGKMECFLTEVEELVDHYKS